MPDTPALTDADLNRALKAMDPGQRAVVSQLICQAGLYVGGYLCGAFNLPATSATMAQLRDALTELADGLFADADASAEAGES